ncbi:apolipoprotein N-acyltransferase [Candidatus Fermentibacteria bacterium]|nr:apolipoprotein N-acyltransferase [Candidatus Fermentibacteria bacterium]
MLLRDGLNLRVVTLLVLSAAAVTLSFPRTALYALVFVALAPTLFVCHGARAGAVFAFRAGWAMGFLAHMGTLWWIARLYPTEITYPWLRLPILILLAAFEGLFYGLAFLGWNAASRHGRWWLWPGVWVVTEYARSLTTLAFPWTVLANTLTAQPLLLQPAAVGGVWLLDLGLAAVNMLVFKAVERPRYAAVAAGLLACWIGGSILSMDTEAGSVDVAIVQPNALPEFKWHQGGKSRVLSDLEALSFAAAESLRDARAPLLIWPETALPMVVRPGGSAEFWLARLVDELGMPLITGALGTSYHRGQDLLTNAAVAVIPGRGIVGRYDKLHLVPFSEKMPFSDTFPAMKNINFGQGDYAPGIESVMLEAGGIRVGVLICFEAILPALVRQHSDSGAELFANITNDSWFGQSGAPEQHASISILRAVEHRRWLVRAANTGLSIIVDPWGRVIRRGGMFRPEVITGSVRPRSDRTVYARTGDWAAWLGILAVAWVAVEAWIRR